MLLRDGMMSFDTVSRLNLCVSFNLSGIVGLNFILNLQVRYSALFDLTIDAMVGLTNEFRSVFFSHKIDPYSITCRWENGGVELLMVSRQVVRSLQPIYRPFLLTAGCRLGIKKPLQGLIN